MARLSGWERVVIVLWVLWGLGAGIFTYNVSMKYRLSTARHDCWEAHYGAPASFNLQECINKNIAHHRPRLLIAALTYPSGEPIPIFFSVNLRSYTQYG
jgi:hypothetical protein